MLSSAWTPRVAEASVYSACRVLVARWPEEITEWPQSHYDAVERASEIAFREPEVTDPSRPLFCRKVTRQHKYSLSHQRTYLPACGFSKIRFDSAHVSDGGKCLV